MSDDNTPVPENGSYGWLDKVIEGGLPQILAGPAGKAISRLIGAGVEIPAAYLDGLAQNIRDKTDARSALSQAIAEHAKEIVVGDPAVMERAVNSMLSRSYRAQLNKESVARVAVEDLRENPPNPESAGPTEDWMDRFERHAEEAGSVDLQFLFGKILAGEIREPGKIGMSTLHLVSMLDSVTASLIDRVLPYTLPNGVTLLDAIPTKLHLTEISFIEQSGFFSADKNYSPPLDDQGGRGEELGHDDFLIVVGKKNSKVEMGGQQFYLLREKVCFKPYNQSLRPNHTAILRSHRPTLNTSCMVKVFVNRTLSKSSNRQLLKTRTLLKSKANEHEFWISMALLHKSVEGRASPFPGRTYPTGSVTDMPRVV